MRRHVRRFGRSSLSRAAAFRFEEANSAKVVISRGSQAMCYSGVGRPANGPARSLPLLPDDGLPDDGDDLDFYLEDHQHQR